MGSAVGPSLHRHGRRVHQHVSTGPHRHLTAPRLSTRPEPADEHARRAHAHAKDGGHDHSHGLIDEEIKRSREGIRSVSRSLGVLGIAAALQAVVFVASGSIALLADVIHNFGDALTALPVGVAFALRSHVAERRAGLLVVAAIFVSACVAGVEAVDRLIHPEVPTHLAILALAGCTGFLGNYLAGRIRTAAGRRLGSVALIADGNHARADAYVSLAVVVSAGAVAVGVPIADPIIGLAITFVILRITLQSWTTVRADHQH